MSCLQLTRAEGDPSAHNLEALPLDELLDGLVDDCEVEAEAKGCSLDADEDRSLPRQRPARALTAGRRKRRAQRHPPRPGGNGGRDRPGTDRATWPTISVRDHGPGVPDDLLGAIFEPFVRVEGDRSRASGGVGLGLAIARRAVDLHRGKITAQNAHPGLLVRIELPGAVELSAEARLVASGGD